MFLNKTRQSLGTALKNYRLMLVYLVSVVLAGYLSAYPALRHLDEQFAHRPAAEDLYPGIRTLYFVQWMREAYRADINLFVMSYFIFLGILFWGIHLILSGGLLSLTYKNGFKVVSIREAFSEGLSVFLRQLASFPLWAIISGGLVAAFWTLSRTIYHHIVTTQQDEWLIPFSIGFAILGIVILFFLSILWDLSRLESIRPGLNPSTAMFRVLFMFLRNGPYYLILILIYRSLEGLILVSGYFLAKGNMNLPVDWSVYLIIPVHLFIGFGRLWVRFGLWQHLAVEFYEEDFVKVARPEGVEPPTL